MKSVLERFLTYITYDTTSKEDTGRYPSTENQLLLGKYLLEEIQSLGLVNCEMDMYGYVTGEIPSNLSEEESCAIEKATGKKLPVIGFIAHMDTSDAVSGADIKPVFVDYQGGDIVQNEALGLSIKVEDYPFLEELVGKKLIVTDGTTLLGADDKAGVAEIMTMAELLMGVDAPKHGKIMIAFTPDEEIGAGTEYFDIQKFGADVAYTVDGGPIGELEYENFNAAQATVTITGRNIHPGEAKGKMKNAAMIACEFVNMLPKLEQPYYTDGYQGFFHLFEMSGDENASKLRFLVRDHDKVKFAEKKEMLLRIAEELNGHWGQGTVTVEIKDQYGNMREVLENHMDLIDNAAAAFRKYGIEPITKPIRGGTDGARLSLLGLPCPNLSTGGYNFHSCQELIPAESLEKMVQVLVEIAKF